MKTSKHGDVYLEKIREKTLSLLQKSPCEFEDEDYHKLRVEIKKLKALAGFIEFFHKSFKRKTHFKPFKKIFKQAGKIRELQLEASFLKKHNPLFIEEYIQSLLNKIEKQKKKFPPLISKKTKRKLKRVIREIESSLEQTTAEDVINFKKNEREKIRQLTQQLPLKPANAHRLRKILKEDFYNRKRLEQPSPKIQAEDNFLELLGKWHDCVVLNNQLGKSILKAKINPAALAELLKINAEVSTKSEKLFAEINDTLRQGLF